MGAWNLKEFKTLCLNSGFDKALFYTNSLAVKWNAAIYHKDNIQKKMSELNFNSALAKGPAYDYEIAFELDSLMLTLNSMWDILGQLVNECFIRPKIPEGDVKFDRILDRYLDSVPTEIQQILKPIQGNKHYNTIRAFANVSKHRHAIPGEVHMDFSDKPPQKLYVITEFEYNGEWHKLTIDDTFKCWEFLDKVGKSVDQVGAKIHKLMK